MKSIAFFSFSRSEFGILSPLISRLKNDSFFKIKLFVGGTHLSKIYGKTINEIKKDSIKIDKKLNEFITKDNKSSIIINLISTTKKLNEIFSKNNFEFICILGDRFELLSILPLALQYKKKIIHIGGGDQTLGSLDNNVRKIISISSLYHFVLLKEHKKNLINQGIDKKNIFISGSLAIERFKNIKYLSKKEIFEKYDLNLNKSLTLLTLHPSLESEYLDYEEKIKLIFNLLKKNNVQTVFTLPNYENDSSKIIKILQKLKKKFDIKYLESLGFEDYNNMIKHCDFVIGNSSSAIIEAPYHRVPTINIGNRQDGRYFHKSIINISYKKKDLERAIKKCYSTVFKKAIKTQKFKYGNGNASNIILKKLKKYL